MTSTSAQPHTRNWDIQPAGDEPVVWSMDSTAGIIQGPLDLNFFSGKNLLLSLKTGQFALLVRDDELLTVFFDGAHTLRIGPEKHETSPDCGLIFLATDNLLSVTWDQSQSIWVGSPDRAPSRLPISGGCSCRINDVARFYEAFLRGGDDSIDSFTLQVIDCLIRSRVEEKLNEFGVDHDFETQTMQSFVDDLDPADMNQGLEQVGLSCEQLAIHLPRASTPSTSNLTTGHSTALGLNQSR